MAGRSLGTRDLVFFSQQNHSKCGLGSFSGVVNGNYRSVIGEIVDLWIMCRYRTAYNTETNQSSPQIKTNLGWFFVV